MMDIKRKAILLALVAMLSFGFGEDVSAARRDNPRPTAAAKAEKTHPSAKVQNGQSRACGYALRKGDCIGVLAPASWEEKSEWEKWPWEELFD